MVRATLLVAAALALVGCNPDPLPGTALGTYHVVAQSQTNTCGLGAPDPWTFDVQLSQQGSTLYWSFMDGSPLLSGTLDAQAQTTISDTTQANVDGSEAGLGPCTMQRADQLQLALAPGTPPVSFTGSFDYGFTVPAGSDCSDQLAASGGQYEALPCSVTYTVTGSRN